MSDLEWKLSCGYYWYRYWWIAPAAALASLILWLAG